MRLDVCLATFKRPELLKRALFSLAAQKLEGITIRVIVVDNDIKKSAEITANTFTKIAPFEVVYDVEPIKNISLARNRAITHVTADFFAFIDDDETVIPTWISELIATMKQNDADVVFGPVIGILPINSPQWAKRLPCFSRSHKNQGEKWSIGGAGNVLIRRSALGSLTHFFDPEYGLSGAEDTDFFYRLYLAKKKLFWCNEAVAFENVPPYRATLNWVCRRYFRGGQNYIRIVIRRHSFLLRAVWFSTKAAQLLFGLMVLPILRFVSYKTHIKILCKVCSVIGQLSMLIGRPVYQEYKQANYRNED